MLKTNTLLTFLGTALLAVLCWLGKGIWEDVSAIKTSSNTTAVQVQNINTELLDHEARIRATEKDVTVLQQYQQREEHGSH